MTGFIRPPVIAFAIAVALAAGVAAGALLGPIVINAAPSDLVNAVPGTAAVELGQFGDPARITLHADLTGDGSVYSTSAGVLSASACSVGAQLTSGQLVATVNGQNVIAVHTAFPLWRDLASGQRGGDVAALRAELARLGGATTDGTVIDKATAAAIRAFFASAGAPLPNSSGVVLPIANIVWLPSETATVMSCPLSIGQQVASGDLLLRVLPTIARFTVTGAQPGAIGGARQIAIDGITAAVPDGGVIDNAEDVAALGSTPSVLAWLAGTAVTEGLPLTWTLAEPITVASVPPAALGSFEGTTACLLSEDGTAVRVTVVSSLLGRALVVAADSDAPLPTTVRLDPVGAATCG